MYRARIALAAAAVVAVLTIFVVSSVGSSLKGAATRQAEQQTERAQLAFPSLDLLRGMELTNETAKMAREEETAKVRERAKDSAEERLLDALLPHPKKMGFSTDVEENPRDQETRQKFRKMLREGQLDEREVEIDLRAVPAGVQIMAPPGMEEMQEQLSSMFANLGGSRTKPRKIKVKEAHKLLNREMAAQTTFATIARELRKYYVTLLIVDQRPSQIYDEVLSQLGTRISGWLGDEDDIHAVLSGLSGRDALRGMLARLQPKEEVLLLGWGVPMPLPVKSRRYDDAFWKSLLKGDSRKSKEENIKELGF